MKSTLFFSAIFMMIFMAGCIDNRDCCNLPDSHIFFVNLQTADGTNLLNNQTDEVIDLSKTRLYLIENGNPKMFKFQSNGVLDDPYGVASVEINDKSLAKISFIYRENQKEVKSFIQWNEVMADTLNLTFNSINRPTYISTVSQNGKILWDVDTDSNSEIMITLEH